MVYVVNQKPLISVVTPAYRCEQSIQELYEALVSTLSEMDTDFEIIFVDDNSPEEDWSCIQSLADKDPRVRGMRLARNFGQHRAIAAGLRVARGEWIVVMDCDLQDQPKEIKKLYRKAVDEGYLVVQGRRVERRDHFFKRWASHLYYRCLSFLIGQPIDSSIANFGLYHRKVIDAVKEMGESSQFFPLQVRWVGFPATAIPIEHGRREYGESSYNLRRMLTLAFNVIVSFSNKPLRFTIGLGFSIACISLLCALYILVCALFGSYQVQGWASLIISIWFLSGLILMFMGMMGYYLGKVFDETKNRPLYIVMERTWE